MCHLDDSFNSKFFIVHILFCRKSKTWQCSRVAIFFITQKLTVNKRLAFAGIWGFSQLPVISYKKKYVVMFTPVSVLRCLCFLQSLSIVIIKLKKLHDSPVLHKSFPSSFAHDPISSCSHYMFKRPFSAMSFSPLSHCTI